MKSSRQGKNETFAIEGGVTHLRNTAKGALNVLQHDLYLCKDQIQKE